MAHLFYSYLEQGRDVTQNILINKDGTVKIADFGLSNTIKFIGQRMGTHCGTPTYLAPEMVSSAEKGGREGARGRESV
jgi:serine/threonine protein kinase